MREQRAPVSTVLLYVIVYPVGLWLVSIESILEAM